MSEEPISNSEKMAESTPKASSLIDRLATVLGFLSAIMPFAAIGIVFVRHRFFSAYKDGFQALGDAILVIPMAIAVGLILGVIATILAIICVIRREGISALGLPMLGVLINGIPIAVLADRFFKQ